MKLRRSITLLLVALLLSGCVANEFQSVTSGVNQTSQTSQTTPAKTEAITTTAATTPAITTEGVPATTDSTPTTTESAPQTTEQPPVTTIPQTGTTTDPKDDPPATPVLEKLTVPSALSALAKQYPVQSKLYGDFAGLSVAELMDAATDFYETAKHRSLTAKGKMTLDSGIVALLLNASRFDLELSYLSGESATLLTSKVTTDQGKVTEDQQVYMGGWLYNTSVSKQDGQQIATDHYKVQMTAQQFSDYALSGMDTLMKDLSVLSQLVATGNTVVAGMDEAGNCIILAKGVNATLLKKLVGTNSAILDALNDDSYKNMEIAVRISSEGVLKEAYFTLPMRMVTKQGGIRFSTDGQMAMTLTLDTPKSVSISVPNGGSSYTAITIEQAYAKDDAWLLW